MNFYGFGTAMRFNYFYAGTNDFTISSKTAFKNPLFLLFLRENQQLVQKPASEISAISVVSS